MAPARHKCITHHRHDRRNDNSDRLLARNRSKGSAPKWFGVLSWCLFVSLQTILAFTMLYNWYRAIRLPISLDEFDRLPRNSAFQYEYEDSAALLSPRPQTLNALLSLRPLVVPASVSASFRRLETGDWPALPALFAAAFHQVQPFAGLRDEDCRQASVECLEQTQTGGDGPLILPACLVAEAHGSIRGAILITLIPRREQGDHWDGFWLEPPPPDAVTRGLARPHLTWLFVAPSWSGQGIGSTLLAFAVNALIELGFSDLASTFLIGNDSSMLWHWRNGFELMPLPTSRRSTRESGT